MHFSVQQSYESYLSMYGNIGRSVQVHPLNLDQCHREKVYARVDQIFDPNNLLQNIEEAHCRALAEFFYNYDYDGVGNKLTVYFLSIANPEGFTYATAVHIRWREDVERLLMHANARLLSSALILKFSQNENGLEWALVPVSMCYFFCQRRGHFASSATPTEQKCEYLYSGCVTRRNV